VGSEEYRVLSLESGAGSALSQPGRGRNQARNLPFKLAVEPQFSIREHILVVGRRVRILKGFVGVWPWCARGEWPAGLHAPRLR